MARTRARTKHNDKDKLKKKKSVAFEEKEASTSGANTEKIRLSCGNEFDIKIKDNGCGVDAKELRWIFEPFDSTATIEKGAGLGLFITKKVLEEQRGTLHFESHAGEGSVVTVRVPQAHTALGYFSSPESMIQA